ncbi:hypothetical protein KIMH_09560 [Bombiscardovia apis]|uniref:Uncharacterized protein n=1 Tax=Bombiscardovia apis TaxID=2932182 RepID=A0ABM8BDN7_9BIFI|nr:hypothetical protein [Bombiscardovia apis]BDR54845.1 hypothetical protein KIMH_09560 [Bombiscardovia apis]
MSTRIEMSHYACNDGQVNVSHASLHISRTPHSAPVQVGDCFDLQSSCDEAERRVIEQLRTYLRPECAPACLIERLQRMFDQLEGADSTDETAASKAV